MVKTITEGKLIFEFEEDWIVYKFDAQGIFPVSIKIDNTKKVDILALSIDKQRLMLIEIKDFRVGGPHADRLGPGATDPIELEFAQKVRDSFSILVAAHRSADQDLKVICNYLFDPTIKPVEVVLFLESPETTVSKYVSPFIRERKILNKLAPYRVNCKVLNRDSDAERTHGGWSVKSVTDSASAS